MEKPFIPTEITHDELEAIERIFKIDLPPCPINIEYYTSVCEKDETALELFQEMIKKV